MTRFSMKRRPSRCLAEASRSAKHPRRPATFGAAILCWLVLFGGSIPAAAQDSPPPEQVTRSTIKEFPAAELLRYAPAPFEIRQPPAMPAVPPRIVHHGPRHAPRVALTFDACATRQKSAFDERLVQVLVATQTPATLFLLGLPEERMRQEIGWTQAVMYSLTGRQALLFRAPYAEIDDRVAGAAAQMGLTSVQYDLASGDPDPAATAERLVRTVAQRARNGSIVVMHMNGRGWHTAEALPVIIDDLRRRGFELTTVGDLIRNP
ncbi:MAG: polysaccharide deacetylase family protein [Desulfobacterales bacterium]|nr:polysaccharide deacetylase family protein [Desulfobacterales bacterium]